MKTLVLYDSNFGNTQKIAEVIAKELSAQAVKISSIHPEELKEYDMLIVGTPIIGWKPTVNMQTFLAQLPDLNGIKATTFDTRVKLFIHGDAMGKVANSLRQRGAEIIIDPMPFYVEGPQKEPQLLSGEIDKAKTWAAAIQSKLT